MWPLIYNMGKLPIIETDDENDKNKTDVPVIEHQPILEPKTYSPILFTGEWPEKLKIMRELQETLNTNVAETSTHSIIKRKAQFLDIDLKKQFIHKFLKDARFTQSKRTIQSYTYAYMGSTINKIYAVILDYHGGLVDIIFGNSFTDGIENDYANVRELWSNILKRHSPSLVVLMDDFYEHAKKNGCPVVEDGNSIESMWDNDFNQFYYGSEMYFENIGFGQSSSRSSFIQFLAVNFYLAQDGIVKRPHGFHTSHHAKIWHIYNDSMTLINTQTGLIEKKKIINNADINSIIESIE